MSERRGPHIKSRTPKQVRLKSPGKKSREANGSKPTPISVKHIQKYKGHDTANGRSVCAACDEAIRFTTIDGVLVAVDFTSGSRHRHQDHHLNTPEMNRARIEMMRLLE